jgi:hypothetical protein
MLPGQIIIHSPDGPVYYRGASGQEHPRRAHKDHPMRTWIATLANFFFPGAGYLVNGQRPKLMALGWLAGVIGLTYVELSLQAAGSELYWPMFVSVLVMNTAFAFDAYQEGRALQGAASPAAA